MNDKTDNIEQTPEPAASAGAALLGMPGSIELVADPIDERLEELSAIAAAWQKNRDLNRPSPTLRRALIMCAEEVANEVRIEAMINAGIENKPDPIEAS